MFSAVVIATFSLCSSYHNNSMASIFKSIAGEQFLSKVLFISFFVNYKIVKFQTGYSMHEGVIAIYTLLAVLTMEKKLLPALLFILEVWDLKTTYVKSCGLTSLMESYLTFDPSSKVKFRWYFKN